MPAVEISDRCSGQSPFVLSKILSQILNKMHNVHCTIVGLHFNCSTLLP